jgi:ABC-type lipoprotein export system ATPase subunit
MISIQNITKQYQGVTAVKDLTLSIPAGCLFGFIGPNGAGKTTTIRILAGILVPDTGTVRIAGIDLNTRPEAAKQKIGFIPDRPYLYEKLTGNEFLKFCADIYGVGPKDFIAARDRYLSLFAMQEYADHLIESYSHGMKQRLVMASALIHDPEIIIVDEPMVGLCFWAGTFWISWRVLVYFSGIDEIGTLLSYKMLSMIITVAFSLLFISAVITTVSRFYLSKDLICVHAMPVATWQVLLSRWTAAFVDGSWMVLLYLIPVLLSYVLFFDRGGLTFVLTAVAGRFAYPAVSMESEAFWIIRSSPVSLSRFLWIKFLVYLVPLFIMAQVLVVTTNTLLHVTVFMMILSIVTTALVVPSVTALAIGIGSIFADFNLESPLKSVTRFGGMVYMTACAALVAAIILLEAGPVYTIFMAGIKNRPLAGYEMAWSAVSFVLVPLICTACVIVPMRLGARHLQQRQ